MKKFIKGWIEKIKKIDWKAEKKRYIFWWSITPRLHFFQDKTMIAVSVLFLKIVYLRTRIK